MASRTQPGQNFVPKFEGPILYFYPCCNTSELAKPVNILLRILDVSSDDFDDIVAVLLDFSGTKTR
jgi:hypothetical protein